MDILYAKESFIKCVLISKSIVCRKRRWFLTSFQPVKILTASYKIIVSWKLNFPMEKKASSGTVPNSLYSAVKYWCQPDQWKECDVRGFAWNVFLRFPPKISEGATYEFLVCGKRFDIFYILKRTPIFIKQPLCDNRTFSLTTIVGGGGSLWAQQFILSLREEMFILSV